LIAHFLALFFFSFSLSVRHDTPLGQTHERKVAAVACSVCTRRGAPHSTARAVATSQGESGAAGTWTWTAGPGGTDGYQAGGAGQAGIPSIGGAAACEQAGTQRRRPASPTPRSYRAPYATAHVWARRWPRPPRPHPTPAGADVDHGRGGRYGVVGRRARERGRASSTWGFWGFLFFPPFRHVTPPSNPPFPSGRFSSPHPRNPRAGKGNQTRRPVVVSSGPLRCGVPSVRVPPSPPPSRAAVRAAGWGIRGRWCARDRDRVASPPSGGVVVPPGAFARAAAAPTHPRYPTNYKRPTFFLPDRAPGLCWANHSLLLSADQTETRPRASRRRNPARACIICVNR
jgi:hypothetical protein